MSVFDIRTDVLTIKEDKRKHNTPYATADNFILLDEVRDLNDCLLLLFCLLYFEVL
jgi:hypothetical protein